MFEKGRRRESKGLAVLYFIIGLVILLIILGVIYFALVKLDYSDQLADPNSQVRSYVSATPTPAAPSEGDDAEDVAFEGMTAVDGEDAGAEDEDLSDEDLPMNEDGEVNMDEVFDEGDETVGDETTDGAREDDEMGFDALDDGGLGDNAAEIIQTATPSPSPSPTPSPTPRPTKVPASKISKSRTSNIKLPSKSSSKGVIGITECEVYEANNNSVMRLAGYGYVNTKKFNGKKAKSYMIVTQRSNNKMIAYQLSMKKGISKRPHKKAKCKNAASSDFQMYINVKKFRDDIYSLALLIAYQPTGSKKVTYAYYPFSSDVSFTVLDGKVVTPVSTVQ